MDELKSISNNVIFFHGDTADEIFMKNVIIEIEQVIDKMVDDNTSAISYAYKGYNKLKEALKA